MNQTEISSFLAQAQGMLNTINQYKNQLPIDERVKLDQQMENVDISEIMKGLTDANTQLSELSKKCQ